ncbi:MAG: pyruvate kinase [Candidatus Moranbacteria bacterium]|nr:pyruvate kinase [Candidatus Moranbacteria bacterium]
MKQTKIVATVGPASESKDTLREMVQAGMNVVRLNFSHGEYEWHAGVINRVRELSQELNTPIAILADMQGPRIRTGVKEAIVLERGGRIRITDQSHSNDLDTSVMPTVTFDMAGVIDGMAPGHAILIEDGRVELTVVEKSEHLVIAEAKNDGVIKNRKGVILPDSTLDLSILTEKDLQDLRFVLQEGVDYVGLSFVGSADDITLVRKEMRQILGEDSRLPLIVAKIERKEAIKNLTAIIKVTDAVMVARGDLGIEMPQSEVVLLQKYIIAESLKAAKPVIVATQMMQSMTESPRPTRAEVSDVSNAVIDHTDAVMLSEESAAGKYPVETVAMMTEIISKTEESPFSDLLAELHLNFYSGTATVLRSANLLAESYKAEAILAFSVTGHTAHLLSHFRPEQKLLVATNSREVWNSLALVWGIQPYLFEDDTNIETFSSRIIERAKEDSLLKTGDQVVVFHGRTPEHDTLRLVGIREVR